MIQNVFANFCLKYHAKYFLYDQISVSRQTEELSDICFFTCKNYLKGLCTERLIYLPHFYTSIDSMPIDFRWA